MRIKTNLINNTDKIKELYQYMYSTKNIENILLAELRNKKAVIADSLNEDTKNQYKTFDNIEEIKEVLNKSEFSQALAAYSNNQIIYRGDKTGFLAAYIVPGTRVSKTIPNVYTKLFSDILPSWSEYPKRNKAAICTNGIRNAGRYGIVYCVFPINNTKIGICSSNDIWFSFEKLDDKYQITEMRTFSELTIKFITYVLEADENIIKECFRGDANKTIQLFKDFETIFKSRIEEYKNKRHLDKITRYDIIDIFDNLYFDFDIKYHDFLGDLAVLVDNGTPILEYFNKLFNPEANGFQLVEINQIPKATDNFITSRELWFSAPYLMIQQKIMEEII